MSWIIGLLESVIVTGLVVISVVVGTVIKWTLWAAYKLGLWNGRK